MDDSSFPPSNNPVFGNIEYDLMEQLLDEGCWIQAADGSHLLQSGIATSRGLSFPGYPMIPGLDPNSSGLTSEKWVLKEEQQAAVDSERQENRQVVTSSASASATVAAAAAAAAARRSLSWESNELNKMLWIPPPRGSNSGISSSVKERLMSAVYHLRELNRDRDVLIQIWVPIKKGLQSFLTTVEQPYFFQPTNKRLHHYRDVSEQYEFLADENTKQALGLPGRVFLGKAPEWTPDVRFFRHDEYPRITYARKFDVRGSIALPVFEKSGAHSLGVVEIIMTTDKFDYRPEVENVCKALETVHLRSSEIRSNLQEQAKKGTYEAVQPEILTVVKTVCDTLDLPLAQTWAPCSQQGKGGCWHSDNNALCVSIIDSACYVRDQRVLDFHRACSDHHLLRSQGGIVGKAFETNQPCYAIDVTEFSKVEYPLSHHAKMFGLRGAVAIRLRASGIYHDLNDYVIELYLPSTVQETGLAFHTRIWQSVSLVIQQHCRHLQFIADKDFEQKGPIPGKSVAENNEPIKENSWFSQMMEPQRKGKEVVSLEFGNEEPSNKGFKVMNWSDSSEPSLQLGQAFSDGVNINQDSTPKEGISGTSSGGRFPFSSRKAGERRRTKTQKTISLDILRQYFAGSLKDAARSIGVCPTTLKRICRQHGIARWPSRKIKKVDHSLRKLQLVIDSVQGAEGSIQLSSFYTKFPELNSPTTEPKPNNQVTSLINLNNQPKQQQSNAPEGTTFPSGGATTTSSTSSSQTSTSSYCFSSGAKISSPSSAAVVGSGTSKDPLTVEDPLGSLKRTRSEAELLQALNKKDESGQTMLERSQSNKTLAEHPSLEPLPPLPITKSWISREAGVFKAKATFGEEKVRFTVLPSMGFLELQQEIIKRFNFEDFSKMGIKYLDDDKEWVLLTCDADLEECIDIYNKSSRSHTIKLCISPLMSLAGSFGSSGLS